MSYLIIQVTSQLKKIIHKRLQSRKRILVDISELSNQDWGGGIQRTQKKLISNWLENHKSENIIFIYTNGNNLYKVKASKKGDELNLYRTSSQIQLTASDVYLNIDLQYTGQYLEGTLLESLQKSQVRTVYLVFDILPVLLPEFFPRNIPEEHLNWCKIAIQSDLIICISKKGMSDLLKFFKKENLTSKLDYVYPGADFSDRRNQIIKKNNKDNDSITEFVMVGTLEPRKNYTKVLRVFQTLWDRNEKVKLTLIGKEGWNVKELIQEIDRLKNYYPDKFNWLQSASDTDLNNLLCTSDCLIQASIDEGFGIPVMEAAHFGINLILNDIEIFREIAGNGAYYINFENPNPEEIISQILNWTELFKRNNNPKSELIETQLWSQSSKQILEKAINVN